MMHRPQQFRETARGGFTLMETAIATVIIGFGVVGLVQLLAAGSMANGDSTELTTAIGLANNIHEMSLGVTFTQIMTLDAQTYSPPIDARQIAMSGMSGWTQQVSVDYVDPNNLKSTVPKTSPEPTALITVTITHNGVVVYTTDWLASAMQWS